MPSNEVQLKKYLRTLAYKTPLQLLSYKTQTPLHRTTRKYKSTF